jgi:signal transduction histidine kinase
VTARTAIRLTEAGWALTVLLALAAAAVTLTSPSSMIASNPLERGLPTLVTILVGTTVGTLIVSRHPANPVGWIFCAASLLLAVGLFLAYYADRALSDPGTELPAGHEAAWLAGLGRAPGMYLFALVFLLFPTGRLPSPHWRWLVWLGAVGMIILAVSQAVATWPPGGAPPDSQPSVAPAGMTARTLGTQVLVLVLLGSAWAMVTRLRRAVGEERQQLRWLAFASALVASMILVEFLPMVFPASPPWLRHWVPSMVYLALAGVPVAAGVAIFKYRLYDIDVIINRAVLFAVLGGFITGGYVAIVVGIGSAIGRRGDLGAGLSLAAMGVVALAFQPVRRRAQRLADRLAYGERAAPYQAMADFSSRMADALWLEEVLPRLAEAAARGVGANRSQVRLFLPQGHAPGVLWPPDTAKHAFDRTVTVRHGQEPVGEIAVAMPPGMPLTKAAAGLLVDLAAQAGLAMHNVRLTVELQRRLEELTRQSAALEASRQRLITARDQEQRRLEREIRVGPYAQLSVIGDKLQQAEQTVGRDPQRLAVLLDDLDQTATRTLETLRGLARGVFPRLLADKGVWVALGAHLRKLDGPVHLEGPPAVTTARFAPQVEAAVYFCCVQALHDAASQAPDAPITVCLEAGEGRLGFAVTHQQPGSEPRDPGDGLSWQHMVDRVEALGGTLRVRAAPDGRSRVEGRIPLQPPTGITDQLERAAVQAAASRSERNIDLGM